MEAEKVDFTAEIVADSVFPGRPRLTTFVLVYPRIIHAEVMSHRVFSRNGASSRAIPVRLNVAKAPYVPPAAFLRENKAGMQGGELLSPEKAQRAQEIWLEMHAACEKGVRELGELGLHKQHANRPLEWSQWMSLIVTSTDWANFFEQRIHPDAQPEMQALALLMHDALQEREPRELEPGEWHLPFFDCYPPRPEVMIASTESCARVSYDKHFVESAQHGKTFAKLAKSRPVHATPFEHLAKPCECSSHKGNLDGWDQLRHDRPMIKSLLATIEEK